MSLQAAFDDWNRGAVTATGKKKVPSLNSVLSPRPTLTIVAEPEILAEWNMEPTRDMPPYLPPLVPEEPHPEAEALAFGRYQSARCRAVVRTVGV